jgi:hypothetical protein
MRSDVGVFLDMREDVVSRPIAVPRDVRWSPYCVERLAETGKGK